MAKYQRYTLILVKKSKKGKNFYFIFFLLIFTLFYVLRKTGNFTKIYHFHLF